MKYEKLKKKTKFGYTKCLLKTLLTFKCVEFDSIINGKTTHNRSFISAIANGYRFGGGIVIHPDADPKDNLLNFVSIDKVNKFVLIKLLIKLLKKKINTVKQFKSEKADFVKIIPCEKNYTVNVDGELYENVPFEVKIISNTLRVYTA